MEKNFLKKGIYGILKFLIITILILLILFVFEKIYSQSDEVKWNKYNNTINQMNRDKLNNWDWDEEKYIWEYKDQPLGQKGENKRILVIGDSFVWGDGYANANHIWWQQLRNKLLENGYNDVEVVAIGLSGLNTYQQYQILLDNSIMSLIDPDLIIFSFVINDTEAWQNPYDDNPIWSNTKPDYNVSSDLLPKVIDSFFLNLYPNLYNKTNSLLVEKYSWMRDSLHMTTTEQEKMLFSDLFLENYLKNVLKPLKDYLENRVMVPYFFVNIPYYPSTETINYINKIEKIFSLADIQFYNLESLYSEQIGWFESSIYNINPTNSHSGTKTTNFVSGKVLEYLEKHYSNILGEKGEVKMDDIIINDFMPRSINLNKIDNYTFIFTYPSKKEKNSFLNMPIEKDYIKLNFMYPVDIKTIEITGKNIEDVDVYINKINSELGYDDQKMYKINYKNKYVWDVNYKKVTSLNISADINGGKSSQLTIKFTKE